MLKVPGREEIGGMRKRKRKRKVVLRAEAEILIFRWVKEAEGRHPPDRGPGQLLPTLTPRTLFQAVWSPTKAPIVLEMVTEGTIHNRFRTAKGLILPMEYPGTDLLSLLLETGIPEFLLWLRLATATERMYDADLSVELTKQCPRLKSIADVCLVLQRFHNKF